MERQFPMLGAIAGMASFVLGSAAGCQPPLPPNDPPLRSPTLDYHSTTITTADGQVLGANNSSPADHLAQVAHVGTENALAPGWRLTADGLEYRPPQSTESTVRMQYVKQASR